MRFVEFHRPASALGRTRSLVQRKLRVARVRLIAHPAGERGRLRSVPGQVARQRRRRRAGTPRAGARSARARRRAAPGRGRDVGGGSSPLPAAAQVAGARGPSCRSQPPTVLAHDLSGALDGRHARDRGRSVLEMPSDVPQPCGATLALAGHLAPHRAFAPVSAQLSHAFRAASCCSAACSSV